ncbi:hypothetical protein Ancab_029486 [Ancistrocladus abbreviatus]
MHLERPPSTMWEAMDLKIRSGNGHTAFGRSFSEHKYDRFATLNKVETTSRMQRFWSNLWRKLSKEKKKMLSRSSSTSKPAAHDPYNPYTYSRNFDQGLTWAEPENLSRSFSARFAASSTVFLINNNQTASC